MSKPRYRLRTADKPLRVPSDPAARFRRDASNLLNQLTWELLARRGLFLYQVMAAHDVSIKDECDALFGMRTDGAERAKSLLRLLGVDCIEQRLGEPTTEQRQAFETVVDQAIFLREQHRLEMERGLCKSLVRKYPELARAVLSAV